MTIEGINTLMVPGELRTLELKKTTGELWVLTKRQCVVYNVIKNDGKVTAKVLPAILGIMK